ncbi:MAG: hypothetical protein QM653_02675 [Dysgonomonas sp.]|uniref:hypothetical protein n=1 Tax=Dysgonomonas sp. TaxID=1891233 RepID=UPI0039E5B815
MNKKILEQIKNTAKAQPQVEAEERNEVIKYLTERYGDKFKQWEKEYAPRKLNYIEVEDKNALLRPIDPETLSNYSMMLVLPEAGGLTAATRYILEELWLDGDEDIRDNDDYFMSAMVQVQHIMEQKKSRFIRL